MREEEGRSGEEGGCSSDARSGGTAQVRERQLPPWGLRTGQDMAAKGSGTDLTGSGEGQLTLRAGDMEDGCGKDLKWEAELET